MLPGAAAPGSVALAYVARMSDAPTAVPWDPAQQSGR